MEINADQKSLIQSVESELESAFLTGVTQSGDFLPKLAGYDTIPEALRPQGRQGILSTFAALVKRMALFRPSRLPLSYMNGFANWPDTSFQAGSVYQSAASGEIVIEGLCYNAISQPAFTVIAVLPEGFRPATSLIFPVSHDATCEPVRILSNGQIVAEFVTTTNPISLSGIRFLPA